MTKMIPTQVSEQLYRVSHLLVHLGWVDLEFDIPLSLCLPYSTWIDVNLAEAVGHLGKITEQ